MSTCDQAGFDLLYCDNRSVPSNFNLGAAATVPTWKACQQACAADPKCKAFTYNPATKKCTKKTTRQFIYQAGAQSGPVTTVRYWAMPQCTPEAQTSGKYKCNAAISSGANIDAPVFKPTFTGCQAMCASDARCAGWTWNPQGACQKKSDATFFYNPKYVSGARSGSVVVDTGASSGTSGASAAATPTPAPTAAVTPTPTAPPETDWWRQVSPLGVEWWIVVAVGLVLLLLMGAVGMMAVMTMG